MPACHKPSSVVKYNLLRWVTYNPSLANARHVCPLPWEELVISFDMPNFGLETRSWRVERRSPEHKARPRSLEYAIRHLYSHAFVTHLSVSVLSVMFSENHHDKTYLVGAYSVAMSWCCLWLQCSSWRFLTTSIAFKVTKYFKFQWLKCSFNVSIYGTYTRNQYDRDSDPTFTLNAWGKSVTPSAALLWFHESHLPLHAPTYSPRCGRPFLRLQWRSLSLF